ncbi:unnamed protein product [Lactuca virosa]|uniref:DUF4283 domain-containing protein n=1 Tax=Lactuca virosa TaxID=75947 RepID=A0AAU9MYF0_9ASTR|nr:unnamed protein product [Lactuca virosa]
MRSLIQLKETPNFEITYIGGLKVLLVFKDFIAAKGFMENRRRWEEYLKWEEDGELESTLKYERVAWIRITGLPLQYWGETNFSAIAAPYGVIIASYDDLPNRVDMSHVKIGILIGIRRRINEEITISLMGTLTRIGIIEFDEDWFPFNFDPVSNPYEEELVDDTESEDGISDTWIPENNTDLEEGEIEMENGGVTDGAVNSGAGEGMPADAHVEKAPREEQSAHAEVLPRMESEHAHGKNTPINSNGKNNSMKANINSQLDRQGPTGENKEIGGNGPSHSIELIGLLDSECFGPCSSRWINSPENSWPNYLPQFNVGGSTLRRHRTYDMAFPFSANQIRPMGNLDSDDVDYGASVPLPNGNTAPVDRSEDGSSIDLIEGARRTHGMYQELNLMIVYPLHWRQRI